jgi:hypothetical protein
MRCDYCPENLNMDTETRPFDAAQYFVAQVGYLLTHWPAALPPNRQRARRDRAGARSDASH